VENLGALSVVLTAQDFDDLDTQASTNPIVGARYPDAMLKRSGL
jgi:hypothetical protein